MRANLFRAGFIVLATLTFSSVIKAQPEFVFPSDGPEQEGLPTEFTIRVSRDGTIRFYDIELSSEKSFDPNLGYPNYQNKRVNPRRTLNVADLSLGGKYYIRTRSFNPFGWNWSPYRLDSITIDTVPYLTYLVNPTSGEYLQDLDNVFEVLFKSGATRYRLEFNTQSDFSGSGEDRLIVNSTNNQITLNWSQFKSSTEYFVRARVRINNTWGPWTEELDPLKVHSFYSPIHLRTIWAPQTDQTLDRTTFKVWVEPINGADEYTFQISNDVGFSNIVDEQVSNKHWRNGALANGFDPTAEYFVYDFFGREVKLKRSTDYWIRVKGSNANQIGNYGAPVKINTGLPVSFVKNIASGSTGVNVNIRLKFQIIPVANTYNLQVSNSSNFTGTVMEFNNIPTSQYVTGLDYNTTYYARVGIDNDPWGDKIISFTTVPEPSAQVTFPMEGQSDIPVNMQFVATPYGDAIYDWEVDTQSDFQSDNRIAVSSSNSKVQFTGLLDYATTYFVRVRALVAAQDITGPWSDAVMFTTLNPLLVASSNDINQTQASNLVLSKVYPNPFKNSFRVLLDGTGQQVNLVLYDSYGTVVFVAEGQEVERLQQEEFGEGLPTGIYFLKVIEMDNGLNKTFHLLKH